MRIYENELKTKPESIKETPVIAAEPEIIEEVEAIVPVVVEQEKEGVVIRLGDMWLKSYRPYLKTADKNEALVLDQKTAESYLPWILLYRRIKAEIIQA